MYKSIEQKKKTDELNELILRILIVNQIFMLIITKIRNKTTDTTTTNQK
jgi:hypothetical protein